VQDVTHPIAPPRLGEFLRPTDRNGKVRKTRRMKRFVNPKCEGADVRCSKDVEEIFHCAVPLWMRDDTIHVELSEKSCARLCSANRWSRIGTNRRVRS
jgi:hypothetical protein